MPEKAAQRLPADAVTDARPFTAQKRFGGERASSAILCLSCRAAPAALRTCMAFHKRAHLKPLLFLCGEAPCAPPRRRQLQCAAFHAGNGKGQAEGVQLQPVAAFFAVPRVACNGIPAGGELYPYLMSTPVEVPAIIFAIVRQTETFLVSLSTLLLCASMNGCDINADTPKISLFSGEEISLPTHLILFCHFSLPIVALGIQS